MKTALTLSMLTVVFLAGLASGQGAAAPALQLVSASQPQMVFAGGTRTVSLTLRNPTDQDYEAELRARVLQTTSATAVRLGEVPWKKLHVLAGQTVLESAHLEFPAVRARTRCLVQWLEPDNHVLGATEVWVYPTNLLAELKPLLRDEPLGVFDPLNQLKPLLHAAKAEVTDLENAELEGFAGKLAILGPFVSSEQMPAGVADKVQALAKRNVAVVWLQPPTPLRDKPQPSFYTVSGSQTAVVVAQAALVAQLADNPQAQLNLLYFCKLALAPEPMQLPHPAAQ